MSTGLHWTRSDLEAWAKRRIARLGADSAFDAEMEQRQSRQIGSPAANPRPRPRPAPIAGRLYPLCLLCAEARLPEPIPEYSFHSTKGWRFDYAWVYQKVAVEIDGGVWTGGRHVRGLGFIEDQRKLNAAALLGWRVLRYTPDRLGEAINDLREILR